MPSKTENNAAYWAGVFDGEGCIMLKCDQRKGCSRPQVSLQISVSNTHFGLIQKLVDDFPPPCGRVINSYLGGSKDQSRRRQQYKWARSGVSALQFLKAVFPFLIVKRKQAELALEFFLLPWRSQRAGRGGTWKIRSNDNVSTDMLYAKRMKELKYASNN